MGENTERAQVWQKQNASSEQGRGGRSAIAALRIVAVSCGLVQLIKAGFVFEGGKAVQQARYSKDAGLKWDAKFEQLKKCELPASRAQQVS